jgi:hypothetical protein
MCFGSCDVYTVLHSGGVGGCIVMRVYKSEV